MQFIERILDVNNAVYLALSAILAFAIYLLLGGGIQTRTRRAIKRLKYDCEKVQYHIDQSTREDWYHLERSKNNLLKLEEKMFDDLSSGAIDLSDEIECYVNLAEELQTKIILGEFNRLFANSFNTKSHH